MAVTHLKPGTISPIHYWMNQKGHIMLMPDSELLGMQRLKRYMNKLGYMLFTAETLKEAEKLQKKMQEQMHREQQVELEKDERMTEYRRQQTRDRLTAKMNSSSTNAYEKDFIRLWLEARNNKHDLFRKRFTQEVGHLDALEFDNPNARLHGMLDKG